MCRTSRATFNRNRDCHTYHLSFKKVYLLQQTNIRLKSDIGDLAITLPLLEKRATEEVYSKCKQKGKIIVCGNFFVKKTKGVRVHLVIDIRWLVKSNMHPIFFDYLLFVVFLRF